VSAAVVKVLTDARRYVANGWTQNADARDKDGWRASPHSDAAVCFCSSGAITRANGPYEANQKARRVLSLVVGGHIPTFNDTHTHEEVLAAFDLAIERVSA